jgi:hypothetical protein
MLTWKLVGVGRLLLMVVLALAPLAPGVGKATPELAIDVDGDGRPERVRLQRHEDAWWLDVETMTAAGPALRSTTRVADGAARAAWRLRAVDGNRDGKMDVLIEGAPGGAALWLSDGVAFTAAAPAALAYAPVARSTTE